MANFEQAYKIVMEHEGGYVDDPDDPGKETYKGVSRRWWPDLEIWPIIDSMKNLPDFPENLKNCEQLNRLIKAFYKREFWNRFWGDEMSNQNIAEELFDTGVNMDVRDAVEFLQIGLNCLNKNEYLYKDIVVDGKFGSKTLFATNSCVGLGLTHYLYKIMNVLQGNKYVENMRKSATKEKYAKGWLNRVDFIKK